MLRIRVSTTTQNQEVASLTATTSDSGTLPFIDPSINNLTGNQIITFATVSGPEIELLPAQQEVPNEYLAVIEEAREHTIKDILSREYSAGTFSIAPGGAVGDLLYSIRPLDFLLTQVNFLDKIRGFAYLRADAEVRFQYTTLPTNSGGIITSYIADVGDQFLVIRRTRNILQMSQLPNVQTTLTSATPIKIQAKWISPFYAKNLIEPATITTGNLGTVIMKRLSPSSGLVINVEVYISLIPGSVHLSWPTPYNPPVPPSLLSSNFIEAAQEMTETELSRNIQLVIEKFQKAIPPIQVCMENETNDIATEEINGFIGVTHPLPMSTKSINVAQVRDPANSLILHGKTERIKASPKVQTESEQVESKGKISGLLNAGAKVANMISHIPVVGGVASTVAPFLKLGSGLLSMFGLSKPVSEKAIRHIKFKPADDHLTMEGILPTHEFGLTRENGVDSQYGPYGSRIDEASVEGIMNVPNIISTFSVSSATARRTVLYSTPLNLCQYNVDGGFIYPTHQFLVSNLFSQWMADLKFDVDVYLTQFHKVQLRFVVLPGSTVQYNVGQVLPSTIDLSKCQSMIVEYGGDNVNASIPIGPRSDTAFRMCPKSTSLITNSLANLAASRLEISNSYGTLLIIVEVPMTNSATVASTVHGVISFSAGNVNLARPRAAISMAPIEHGLKADGVLDTDFFKLSRSERLISGADQLNDSSAASNTDNQLALCVGEKFKHLRQFLNGYTKFHNGLINVNISLGLVVDPTIRRTFNNLNPHVDHFDYLMSIFGFHKGKVHLRVADTGPPGTSGNMMLINAADTTLGLSQQLTGTDLIRWGFAVGPAGFATSGTRTIPIQAEESVPDFSVPYYQAGHIIRTHYRSNSNPPSPGEEAPNFLAFGSMQNQVVELFRCTGDDFTMGFLMSVPRFQLVDAGFLPA